MVSALFRTYRREGARGVRWHVRKQFGLRRRLQSNLKIGRTITTVYGIRLACNFDDFTFRHYVNGVYGYFLWDHISSIKHPFVFLDIGANQGLYTLCAARNPNNLHSYAFEPSEKTFGYLVQNITLNRAQSKCTPLALAIADSTGTAALRMKSNHSGGATLAQKNPTTLEGDETLNVETIDHSGLDELVEDRETPIMVKVDVEGFEPVVLSELMKSELAPRISEMFYEVNEHWIDPDQLVRLLQANGFKHFKKLGGKTQYDVLASR
ncbi:FkbM family methyltransferase [uncultured Shimia sp.]|uniref:FkbM family methyltransferase n=1 Tax=uncultured Shimia sp. TaxID=573152 RepID=UPI002639D3EF|nr:FkbM family methyltransferase [uncultured Shimia sp.]